LDNLVDLVTFLLIFNCPTSVNTTTALTFCSECFLSTKTLNMIHTEQTDWTVYSELKHNAAV